MANGNALTTCMRFFVGPTLLVIDIVGDNSPTVHNDADVNEQGEWGASLTCTFANWSENRHRHTRRSCPPHIGSHAFFPDSALRTDNCHVYLDSVGEFRIGQVVPEGLSRRLRDRVQELLDHNIRWCS